MWVFQMARIEQVSFEIVWAPFEGLHDDEHRQEDNADQKCHNHTRLVGLLSYQQHPAGCHHKDCKLSSIGGV